MVKVTGCGQFGVLLTEKGINADWEPMPTLMVVGLKGCSKNVKLIASHLITTVSGTFL
jgi:hypothetical protein